jgi:hypothetical protein
MLAKRPLKIGMIGRYGWILNEFKCGLTINKTSTYSVAVVAIEEDIS